MPSLNNDNFTSLMKVQISKKLRTPEAGQVQRKQHLRIRVKLLRTTFNKQVLMEPQRREDTSHPRRLGEQQMVYSKTQCGLRDNRKNVFENGEYHITTSRIRCMVMWRSVMKTHVFETFCLLCPCKC